METFFFCIEIMNIQTLQGIIIPEKNFNKSRSKKQYKMNRKIENTINSHRAIEAACLNRITY